MLSKGISRGSWPESLRTTFFLDFCLRVWFSNLFCESRLSTWNYLIISPSCSFPSPQLQFHLLEARAWGRGDELPLNSSTRKSHQGLKDKVTVVLVWWWRHLQGCGQFQIKERYRDQKNPDIQHWSCAQNEHKLSEITLGKRSRGFI